MSAFWVAPEHDEAAYRLHLLALGEGGAEVRPGYRRAEEPLRRRLGVRFGTPPAWASVAEALSAEVAPEDDRRWFEQRKTVGGERVDLQGLIAGTEALLEAGLPWPKGGPTPLTLVVSGAVKPIPVPVRAVASACAPGPVVAAGVGVAPSLLILAAHALPWVDGVPRALPVVPEADVKTGVLPFLVLMAAGAELAAAGAGGAALDTLLVDFTRDIVPPQHRGAGLQAALQRLAEAGCFDTPPGELARLIEGIGRRRPDRVHRAWQKRAFWPRGLAQESGESVGMVGG